MSNERRLPINRCLIESPHGPHDWWYTSWGRGHMLSGEPTESDRRTEKNLKQHHCPGVESEVVDLVAALRASVEARKQAELGQRDE
jgi:hypothetical protein